jgi:hypothetical protein
MPQRRFPMPMPRPIWRSASLAAIGLVLAGTARAETAVTVPTGTGSGISLRLSTPLTVMPQFGFLPLRVSIRNQLARTGTWKIRLQAGSRVAPAGELASSLEISVDAGQARDAWYFVPLADAAPRFTLGERPATNARAQPVIRPAATAAPAAAAVEAHAQAKLGFGTRLSWSSHMERGDRPGELIGVATASQIVSSDAPPMPGRELPLGFAVEDAYDPVTGWYTRRYYYKEAVPDPAGVTAPIPSFWRAVNTSVTAESAARAVLAETGLLSVPAGVRQATLVGMIASGFAGRQAAWLTTFVQTGSSRVLPLQTGPDLPPGTIVNLHGTNAPGEVVRTITFVDPERLVPPTSEEALSPDLLEEARATLLRYGFLRPIAGVRVTTEYPGSGGFALPEQHQGSVVWFEIGPAALLPAPFFGTLPPDTVAYLLPGNSPGEAIRCFVIAPRLHLPAPTAAGGAAPGDSSSFSVVVTGTGVIGAQEVTFPDLSSAKSGLALPIAVSSSSAAKLRKTLSIGGLRGTPNLASIAADDLPADWRFYSPYHLVFLGGAEYAGLDPARRAALLDWVVQGGQLMLEPVAEYSPLDPPLVEPRVPLEQRPLGAGMVTQLSYLLDDYLAPMDIDETIPDQPVWVKLAEPVELLPLLRLYQPALTLPNDEALRQPRRWPGPSAADASGDGKWAAGLLVGLALLAGPANLLFFAPAGRRHRFLVTGPLVAAGGAAVLAACVVIWEGFGGTGDRSVVVMLVPGQDRAVVFQDQMAETALLGRRTFAVPETTALANIAVEGFDATGRGAALERRGGVAGGDWFRNRWGSAQHLRQIVSVGGRVAVRPGPGGTPVVESGLTATLRSFVYLETIDRIWYAPEVPAGVPVTLRRLNVRRWPPLKPAGSPYLATVLAATAPLAPGRWMARTDTTAIAPIPTLASIAWHDDVIFTGSADAR